MLYDAYELYIAAGLWNYAHDLAVLELAPDAVIRRDYELLKELFSRMSGQSVDGWHVRGKVRFIPLASLIALKHSGLFGLRACDDASA